MAVAQITRFSGGDPEEMVALAKRAKAIWMKHGAETCLVSRVHTGAWVGQWLFLVRCADWATFGKAQEAISKDLEFKKVLSETLSKCKLEGRNVLVGYDI